MSLLRIQLRTERVGLLGWGIGLFVLTLTVALSFTAIEEDAAAFEEAFESFGDIEAAFGVDSLTSPDGYLKSNSFALYPLLLGIYGGLAATKAFAGAQESGRLDHVLSRPLSRTRYLWVNATALGLGQVAIVLAAGIGAVLGYTAIGQPAGVVGRSFAMALDVLPVALVHVSLGILAAAWADRKGAAVGLVMAIVVGGFAIDLVGNLVDALDWLQYLTPYGYWGRSDLYNGDPDPLYLVVSTVLVVAALAVARWRFDRKDL